MNTDYLQIIYKKLKHLRSNFYIEELDKILQWIESSRSLQYHRMMMKFMTYLWQQTDINNFDEFMDILKYNVNFCSRKIIKIKGQECIFIKPMSISFGKTSQKVFRKFCEDVIAYAKEHYQVDFQLWEREYYTNPELLT